MAVAVFVVLLRFVRGKNWWAKLRPGLQCTAGGGHGLLGGMAALGGPFL